jgi:formate/nitrite transporter FocA (FNT family)
MINQPILITTVGSLLGFTSVFGFACVLIWLNRKGVPAETLRRIGVKWGAIVGAFCPGLIIFIILSRQLHNFLRVAYLHPLLLRSILVDTLWSIPLGAVIGALIGLIFCFWIQWIDKVRNKLKRAN